MSGADNAWSASCAARVPFAQASARRKILGADVVVEAIVGHPCRDERLELGVDDAPELGPRLACTGAESREDLSTHRRSTVASACAGGGRDERQSVQVRLPDRPTTGYRLASHGIARRSRAHHRPRGRPRPPRQHACSCLRLPSRGREGMVRARGVGEPSHPEAPRASLRRAPRDPDGAVVRRPVGLDDGRRRGRRRDGGARSRRRCAAHAVDASRVPRAWLRDLDALPRDGLPLPARGVRARRRTLLDLVRPTRLRGRWCARDHDRRGDRDSGRRRRALRGHRAAMLGLPGSRSVRLVACLEAARSRHEDVHRLARQHARGLCRALTLDDRRQLERARDQFSQRRRRALPAQSFACSSSTARSRRS